MFSKEEKFKYSPHLFKDDALIIYQSEIEGNHSKLDDTVSQMEREFNIILKQQHICRERNAPWTEKFKESTTSMVQPLDNLNPYTLNYAQLLTSHKRKKDNNTAL